MVDLQQVAKLRQQTGCGINDCRNALEEAGGDTEKALDILRKKGELKASKKSAERETRRYQRKYLPTVRQNHPVVPTVLRFPTNSAVPAADCERNLQKPYSLTEHSGHRL